MILSAGSIQTPQILELSGEFSFCKTIKHNSTHQGIGQKKILDKYGIPTVVELPGVGENFRGCSFLTAPSLNHLQLKQRLASVSTVLTCILLYITRAGSISRCYVV